MNRYPQLISVAVVCCGVLGCASEKLPPLHPVEGRVTIDGKPLTSGHVSLTSSSTEYKIGILASEIGEDGTYAIGTTDKDGAPLGKYKVTVTPRTMMAPGANSRNDDVGRIYADATNASRIEVVASPGAGAMI